MPRTRSIVRLLLVVLGTGLGLAVSPAAALADTWRIDKAHGEVRFSYTHLGLSRQSGRFTDVDATLEFSPTEPERGTVEARIRVASVLTGVKELDDVLKRPDFFDAASYPYITFKSTGVKATGERVGELQGDLTIMGVTRPVTMQVTWNFTGAHPLASINPAYTGQWASGFSAKTTIQRSEWGIKRVVPLVSDEIEIGIEIEFLRKGE